MNKVRWLTLITVVIAINWLAALIILTMAAYGVDLPFERGPVGWYHGLIGAIFFVIGAIVEAESD